MASSDHHFLADKRIIVAGAGIAGLAFVISLHKQWDSSFGPIPNVVIYDRDPREVSQQREGYSLSLNGMEAGSGLIALRDMGLLDEILKHALAGTNSTRSFRMWDGEWNDLIKMSFNAYDGLPTPGIRVARKELRAILIKAAEDVVPITWGTGCSSVEHLENGRFRVCLDGKDGATVTDGDIVIAADGAHSKIRAALRPDDKLTYQGCVQIGGVAKFPDGNIPKPIDRSWGMAVSGEGVSCFMAPVDETSAVWAISCKESEARTRLEPGQEEALLKEVKEIGRMLRGPFPAMLAATDPSTAFVIPARDKQPFRHDGSNLPSGVVFIGDSNHAVSPFAGNGANLALKDGWDLATTLCHSEGAKKMEDAVRAYDEVSVPRAAKTVKTSHYRMAIAHSDSWKWWFLKIAFRLGGFMMRLMK